MRETLGMSNAIGAVQQSGDGADIDVDLTHCTVGTPGADVNANVSVHSLSAECQNFARVPILSVALSLYFTGQHLRG